MLLKNNFSEEEKKAQLDWENEEIHPIEVLVILGRYKYWLLGIPLVVALLVLAFNFNNDPVYTARSSFLTPSSDFGTLTEPIQQVEQSRGLATSRFAVLQSVSSRRYLDMLQSRRFRDQLINQLDLRSHYGVESNQKLYEMLWGVIKLIPNDKAGIIYIEVSDTDAAFAAKMANAHVEILGKFLSDIASYEAQNERAFFEERLKETAEFVIDYEEELKLLQQQMGALQKGGQVNQTLSAIERLQLAINSQVALLASISQYSTENHPSYQQVFSRYQALKAQLKGLQAEDAQRGESFLSLNQLPGLAQNFRQIERRVEFYVEQYKLLLSQFELATIEAQIDLAPIVQVDVAQPPIRAELPEYIKKVTVGGILTFLLCCVVVFWVGAVKKLKQSPEGQHILPPLRRAWLTW